MAAVVHGLVAGSVVEVRRSPPPRRSPPASAGRGMAYGNRGLPLATPLPPWGRGGAPGCFHQKVGCEARP